MMHGHKNLKLPKTLKKLLWYSQQPDICPQSEPDKFTPRLAILLKINFNIILQSTLRFIKLSPSSSKYSLYFCLVPLASATPSSPILLDIITRTIFRGEAKSRRSSLRIFVLSAPTCSQRSPNILLSTLFLNTLSPCPSLNVQTKFLTHIRKGNKSMYSPGQTLTVPGSWNSQISR